MVYLYNPHPQGMPVQEKGQERRTSGLDQAASLVDYAGRSATRATLHVVLA